MLDSLVSGSEEILSLSSPNTSTYLLDFNSRAKVLIRPAFKRQTNSTSKTILGDEAVSPLNEMPVASSSKFPSYCRPTSAEPSYKTRQREERKQKAKSSYPYPGEKTRFPSPLDKSNRLEPTRESYDKDPALPLSPHHSPPKVPHTLHTAENQASLPHATPTPTSRASSASSSASSVYSEDILNCPCNTRKDYDCRRCRILRLADSFCSLVEMKCELLTPPPTPSAPASILLSS